jgi:hypothetical protein
MGKLSYESGDTRQTGSKAEKATIKVGDTPVSLLVSPSVTRSYHG